MFSPVFIGGAPRSGSTMLGAMLGASADCIATPESPFKIALLRLSTRPNGPPGWDRFVDRLRRHPSVRDWGLTDAVGGLREAGIDRSPAAITEWMVRRYCGGDGAGGATIWIDHLPDNIRYAGELLREFEDSRLIHLVRDGRAVAASVLPLAWGPNTFRAAARWWLEYIAHGLAVERQAPADRVIRVHYEDLVAEPEHTLARLCGFLGARYEPEMITGPGMHLPGRTADQHRLVGRAPDPARISAWKEDLDSRGVEVFESIASGVLQSLGYVPEFGIRARRMGVVERIRSLCREAVLRPLNRRRSDRRARRRRRHATGSPVTGASP